MDLETSDTEPSLDDEFGRGSGETDSDSDDARAAGFGPTTGRWPPAAGRAPIRPAPRARRLRVARELVYAGCATTGGRPPEDAYAPIKAAGFARRVGGQ